MDPVLLGGTDYSARRSFLCKRWRFHVINESLLAICFLIHFLLALSCLVRLLLLVRRLRRLRPVIFSSDNHTKVGPAGHRSTLSLFLLRLLSCLLTYRHHRLPLCSTLRTVSLSWFIPSASSQRSGSTSFAYRSGQMSTRFRSLFFLHSATTTITTTITALPPTSFRYVPNFLWFVSRKKKLARHRTIVFRSAPGKVARVWFGGAVFPDSDDDGTAGGVSTGRIVLCPVHPAWRTDAAAEA